MTNQEHIEMIRSIKAYMTAGNPIWDTYKIAEACDAAISALQAQERTESLYQMACERIDAVYTEPSKYDLGRISALADATGHVMQAFNPD